MRNENQWLTPLSKVTTCTPAYRRELRRLWRVHFTTTNLLEDRWNRFIHIYVDWTCLVARCQFTFRSFLISSSAWYKRATVEHKLAALFVVFNTFLYHPPKPFLWLPSSRLFSFSTIRTMVDSSNLVFVCKSKCCACCLGGGAPMFQVIEDISFLVDVHLKCMVCLLVCLYMLA